MRKVKSGIYDPFNKTARSNDKRTYQLVVVGLAQVAHKHQIMLTVFLLVKNQSFLARLALRRGILEAQFVFEIKSNESRMVRRSSHLQTTQRALQKFLQSVADL